MQYQNLRTPAAEWKGLDLRHSALLRDPDYCSDVENALVNRAGTLTCRPGSQVAHASAGGGGLARYSYVSTTTGLAVTEKLVIGESLTKINTGTFAITYTPGSLLSIYVSMLLDTTTSTWHFLLVGDGTTLLDYDCGVGFDEASIKTLANLKTQVDLVSGFSSVITGTTSTPAAFLRTTDSAPFVSNALSLSFEYSSAVKQPASAANPFHSHYAQMNSETFQLATWFHARQNIYFCTGFDEMQKYDGQKIYRAGMPASSTPTAAVVANATGRTGTNIAYRHSYIQVDAQGNIQEGVLNTASNTVSPAADYVDVTVVPVQKTSGFNTDCAMVAGAQSGAGTQTGLTVDDGSGGAHTLQAGDIAYFYDSVSGAHVTRTITSVTASTIVWASTTAVNVANDAPISANLRIGLYTQVVEDGDYYLVDEYPNNSWLSSQVLRDLGGTIGAQYLEPLVGAEPQLPPKGRFGTIFKGVAVVVGNLSNPNVGYYSDVSSPESFPTVSNQFTTTTANQSPWSGVFPTVDSLYLFKNKSSHLLTGDFDSETGFFRFRIDDISITTGCAAQSSIRQISDGSILFLSDKGVFRCQGAAIPTEASVNILPVFTKLNPPSDELLVFRRSVAVYDEKREKYILFIPAETTTSGDIAANSHSRILVLDLFNSGWWEWSNQNLEAGAEMFDDTLYWVEKRYSTYNGARAFNLHRRLESGTIYDQIDHSSAIPWFAEMGWVDLGNSSQFKKPLRAKFYSNDPEMAGAFVLHVDVNHDYRGIIETSLDLDFSALSSAGWGSLPWGTGTWGSPDEPSIERKLLPRKVQSYRYVMSHETIYELPLVTAIDTEVAVPFRPEMKE